MAWEGGKRMLVVWGKRRGEESSVPRGRGEPAVGRIAIFFQRSKIPTGTHPAQLQEGKASHTKETKGKKTAEKGRSFFPSPASVQMEGK